MIDPAGAPGLAAPTQRRGGTLASRAREAFRQAWARLQGGELTPMRMALSLALGIFVGCVPVYGLQTWLCLALALPLRLHYPLAYLATWIANPLSAPFLVVAEVEVGVFLWTGRFAPLSVAELRARGLGSAFGYAMLGSVVVGSVLSLLGAGIALLWARARRARMARTAPE